MITMFDVDTPIVERKKVIEDKELIKNIYRFLSMKQRYIELRDDQYSPEALAYRIRVISKKENIKNIKVHILCRKTKVVLENTDYA